MKVRVKLAPVMQEMRGRIAEWQKANPKAHPCEMYKDIADAIVQRIKAQGDVVVEVPMAVYMGGVPEYTYTIARLAEEGIPTYPERSENELQTKTKGIRIVGDP